MPAKVTLEEANLFHYGWITYEFRTCGVCTFYHSLYAFHLPFRIACRVRDTREGRQAVFYTAVDPMTDSQNPRKVQYNTKWNVFRDAIYCITLRQAQDEGLEIWQTRSTAIFFYDAVPADRVERVVNMKTEEILRQKVSLSPRPRPKTVLKDIWQVQRKYSHQHGTSTERP